MTHRRTITWLAALAAALIAASGVPLRAQDSPSAPGTAASPIAFTLHGEAFAVPAPGGYCVPTGELAAFAQTTDSWDSQNLTPVSLHRCGTGWQDIILIKTPRDAERIEQDRAAFLAMMTAQFSPELLAEAIAAGGRDASRGSGMALEIDSSAFGYRGADDVCVYLGGTFAVAGDDGDQITGQGGACVTLIRGRMFTVNAFDVTPGGADSAALMARARAVALTIR